MSLAVTAYLCSEELGVPWFESDGYEMEVTPGSVVAKLVPDEIPEGCNIEAETVYVPITLPGYPEFCTMLGGFITWKRKTVTIFGQVELDGALIVTIRAPDHCLWSSCLVQPQLADYNSWSWSQGAVGGGQIPDNRDDVCPCGKEYEKEVTQIQFVPGQFLLDSEFFTRKGVTKQGGFRVAEFGTCCLIGGKVKEVIGDYGSVDIAYTVEIFGRDCYCVSSDFIEWAVNDWVFVFVPSSECEERVRESACIKALDTFIADGEE